MQYCYEAGVSGGISVVIVSHIRGYVVEGVRLAANASQKLCLMHERMRPLVKKKERNES